MASYVPSRRAAIVGAVAAASGGLAGCGRRRSPDAIGFWAMSYEGDYSPILTTAFTAATGVPVDHQSLPSTAAHEKLLTALAGDALPDVVALPNEWVGEFAMAGALAPVTDPALTADLFPGAAALTRYRGRPYAVPWSLSPQLQYYRRDLLAAVGFDAPPDRWGEWRAAAIALKRRRPDDYVVLMYLNWWDTLFTLALQAGAPMLRDRATRGAFSEARFAHAMAFYVSLFELGLAPRALSTEIQDPLAAFGQGMFALYPNSPVLLLDLHRRAHLIPRERWAVTRMPGPTGPGPVSSVSTSLAVTARARRPAQAWTLVRYLTTVPAELRLQRLIGKLPARPSAWDTPQMRNPLLRPFVAQADVPAPSPDVVEWERIRLEVQLVAERVVRGLATLEEGLAEMDRRADRILARRRALVDAGRIA